MNVFLNQMKMNDILYQTLKMAFFQNVMKIVYHAKMDQLKMILEKLKVWNASNAKTQII